MNIVEAYAAQLQLTENAAQGLAGQVLGLIEDTVRDRVSFGVALRIRDAVPEMALWQVAAPTLRPGTLLAADVLKAPSGQQPELHGLLERFRVDVKESSRVNELALDFLSTRLEPSVVSVIERAVRG